MLTKKSCCKQGNCQQFQPDNSGRTEYDSNIQTPEVLMKRRPCIILKLFLNFSDSEPYYCYKFYSYKKCVL